MSMPKDFLAELISERTKRNSKFPSLVAEAQARKDIARALTARREKRRLSQTQVAALMNTSASVVSKLESGGDVKLSTMQRYCSVIGAKLPIAR
ncbi:MAG: XRE family transcriptional regulator [Sandaracinaceae bacterium]|nr:XRE family transcriptional regulator [Sandaracinaceae bacterium]